MAKTNGEVGSGEQTVVRKRRAPEGPRKIKPVHTAIRVTDESGNEIPGARIEIVAASKDFETVYSHLDANPGTKHVRIPLDSLA